MAEYQKRIILLRAKALGLSLEEALKMPKFDLEALIYIDEMTKEEQQRLISERGTKNVGIS